MLSIYYYCPTVTKIGTCWQIVAKCSNSKSDEKTIPDSSVVTYAEREADTMKLTGATVSFLQTKSRKTSEITFSMKCIK